MSMVVEMIRNSIEAGGRDRFECSNTEWDLLLALGRKHGWEPRGTSYGAKGGEMLSDAIGVHDYTPGDSRDRKYVDAGDANAWALALSIARSSADLEPVPGGVSAGLINYALLDEFIEYAHGGAFAFARRK